MTAKAEPAGASKLLIDFGPLLLFFLVNFLAPVSPLTKIFVATGVFMVAMVAAVAGAPAAHRALSTSLSSSPGALRPAGPISWGMLQLLGLRLCPDHRLEDNLLQDVEAGASAIARQDAAARRVRIVWR